MRVTEARQDGSSHESMISGRESQGISPVADGAPDNCESLHELGRGVGVEVLDVYHAATHINVATRQRVQPARLLRR